MVPAGTACVACSRTRYRPGLAIVSVEADGTQTVTDGGGDNAGNRGRGSSISEPLTSTCPEENNYSVGSAPEKNIDTLGTHRANDFPLKSTPDDHTNEISVHSLGPASEDLAVLDPPLPRRPTFAEEEDMLGTVVSVPPRTIRRRSTSYGSAVSVEAADHASRAP